ncbi:BON domain protein [Vibrio harveyi]|uniref:BON domain protein n=1 Tax=Vibrio harveyi TaxID=669 RepID=A0A454CMH4_VIBHA|nr:BON domain protein [Vibrio harveyi]
MITEDSDVFLFGYVTPQQSDRATEIARNISGVKQVIKGFQYGDEKPLKVEEPETTQPEATVTELGSQVN